MGLLGEPRGLGVALTYVIDRREACTGATQGDQLRWMGRAVKGFVKLERKFRGSSRTKGKTRPARGAAACTFHFGAFWCTVGAVVSKLFQTHPHC